MNRPHFTLRTLLIATACSALLAAYVVVPTLRARQFALDFNRENEAALSAVDNYNSRDAIRQFARRYPNRPVMAYVHDLTLSDIVFGVRRLSILEEHISGHEVYIGRRLSGTLRVGMIQNGLTLGEIQGNNSDVIGLSEREVEQD